MTGRSMAPPRPSAVRECRRPVSCLAERSPCSTCGGNAWATAGRSPYDAFYEVRKPFWRE